MTRFKTKTRQAGSRRHGVAATEFAVCLPIIVLLVLAMIESCTMIFLKQSLSIAAYEGVRTALTENAQAADVHQSCQQILSDRRVQSAVVTITPSNFDSLPVGTYIEVSVTAPADDNSVIPGNFFRGRTLTGQATMMKEL